jgi:two-component system response regulator YesN
MIRAVVIDDEKLVRKGFISLIDWSRFGIVMVGEAGDGKTALELLEKTEADLLFVDITMPGMSGFDVIRQVRVRFPRLKSVVLTCHHEFDFVQEALRLGAIDYIVKTLFEMDNADEVINRIVERFEWEVGSQASLLADSAQKRMSTPTAVLFVPLAHERNSAPLYRIGFVRRNPLEELEGMWMTQLVHPNALEELGTELGEEWFRSWQVGIVSGLEGLTVEEVRRTAEGSLTNALFYASDPASPVRLAYKELKELESRRNASGSDLDAGADLKWTLYPAEWSAFLREMEERRPTKEALHRCAEALCRNWGGMLIHASHAAAMLAESGANRTWVDWKSWLRRFADLVQLRMVELSLTKEVMLCIIRAIRYMKANAGLKINQADVSEYANMSRSYFSQCFARMAGEPFGTVLRNMRIDKAKTLLLESSAPIYEIASMAGFEDDKYFSKLFRERVGKLPTEYRAERGKFV